MGRINKLKNGRYKVDVHDQSGQRLRPTFDRRGEAEAFIAKIEAAKNEKKLAGKALRKKKVTFESAIQDFLNSKSDLRESSIRKYNYVINQFKSFVEALGITYVNDFTTHHATLLFHEIIKEKPDPKGSTDRILKPKPKTVNFFLMTFREFFQNEVIKGTITKSPMLHVKNQKVEKKHPEYYSESELQKFFSQEMPESYRDAFLGLLHTGMRFGELANLTWDDVNLEKRLINVRSTETHKTKTFNSIRSIPVNETLLAVLTRLSLKKLSLTYVFTSPQGMQLRERKTLEKCKDIAATAGITSNAYLHKFRHTYATHLVQRGVPIEAIQKLLGHARIEETMIYAHMKPETLHKEVSVLDDLIKAKTKEKKDSSSEEEKPPKE